MNSGMLGPLPHGVLVKPWWSSHFWRGDSGPNPWRCCTIFDTKPKKGIKGGTI